MAHGTRRLDGKGRGPFIEETPVLGERNALPIKDFHPQIGRYGSWWHDPEWAFKDLTTRPRLSDPALPCPKLQTALKQKVQ